MLLAFLFFKAYHTSRCVVKEFCDTCDNRSAPRKFLWIDAVLAILAVLELIERSIP